MYIEPNISYIEKAYARLKQAIVFNQLKQGEVLNERDLSARLNISRTPLSSALNHLMWDGWLKKSGKSKVVAEVSWNDIQEIYELRVMAECFAAKKAARNITPALASQMNALLTVMGEEFERDNDSIAYLQRDRDWHCFIGKVANNGRLDSMLEGLHEQFVRISLITTKRGSGRILESMNEHHALAVAIAQHDPNGAAKACEKHVTAWFTSLSENWDKE